jgi:ketosteroid isomerase-like protein
MLMTAEPIDVIRSLHDAMNAHDASAAAMCTAPDVEIQAPTGEMRGRDAIQLIAQTFMTAFPDNEWVESHQVSAGDTVATEYVLEGTHSGTLQTPMGALMPTGRRVTSRACDVSRVRDGEVYSTHLYWDNLSFMSALGIVPVAQPIPRASAIGRRWEPDPDADPSATEDVAARLHDALNAHDVDGVVSLASDDVEVVAPTVEDKGRYAFAELVGLYLGAFPDIKWHAMHQISSGDTVVTEQLVEGTHQGAYAAAQGDFGPTGNRGVTRVCQVLRVRHGVMESVHLYWDHLVLLQTLGAFSQ